MNDQDFGAGFFTGLCFAVLLATGFSYIVDDYNDTHYREIIIENGCGEYDSNTAEFKLINRRDK